MAPEQACGASVDKRADICSFGVVLYEMLPGKQPFTRPTLPDTLVAVLQTEPDWVHLPVGMRQFVRHCLHKDPRRRLRDIGEAWLGLEESGESPPTPPRKGLLSWAIAGARAVIIVISSGLSPQRF